jgi:hypothetical protein
MRPIVVTLFIVVFCACLNAGAQVPPGINYQGVARDLEGKPLGLRNINIRISILRDGEDGQAEYVETHSVKTNSFGLFTLVIGKGESVVGDFHFISWSVGTKWMKVDMDPEGGSDFKSMGAQSFMSVPYAFYSQYSGNGVTAGQGISINNSVISNTGDADNNPLNEVNTSVTLGSDRRLRITDAGGTKEADLSALATAQQLSGVLQLGNDAANNRIVNLGAPLAPADAATKAYVDAQADNQTLTVNGTEDDRTIAITNGGAITFSVADDDHSISNEMQDLSIVGHELLLSGDVTSINLGVYLDNTDSQSLALGTSAGNNRTINIANGTGVTFSVADTDSDASNEIQQLGLAANNLTISGDAATIDLSPYLDNTDSQGLSAGVSSGTNRTINITNGSSVTFSVADSDNDASNEIQQLTLSSNSLVLSSGGSQVDLAPYLDDTDNQNLIMGLNSGTDRTINIADGTGVTFSVADNDNDASNELQELSLSGMTLSLTGNGSSVNIASFFDDTDDQNLTAASVGDNRTINITNGAGVTFSVADDDNSVTNEIQDITLFGNTLTLSGDGTAVDLAPYLDDTDDQSLVMGANSGTTRTINIDNGTGVSFSVADDDSSITNEIQDLALSGNTLSITNSASPTVINLATYLDNTDAQTLLYDPLTKSLSIQNGNNVTLTETQNLNQVLGQGADAGAQRVTNLGTPTAPADAVTKQYVDDALTNFAFKTNFNYVNPGLAASDVILPIIGEQFDDSNVIAGNSFVAPVTGTYVFVIDGAIAGLGLPGPQISFLFAGVKHPIAMGNRYNSTQMFRMNAGQTITLIGDNILLGGSFTGTFYGYKL